MRAMKSRMSGSVGLASAARRATCTATVGMSETAQQSGHFEEARRRIREVRQTIVRRVFDGRHIRESAGENGFPHRRGLVRLSQCLIGRLQQLVRRPHRRIGAGKRSGVLDHLVPLPTASGNAGESERRVQGGVLAGCFGGEFVIARGFVELVLLEESVGQLQKRGNMIGLDRHGLLQQVELLLFVSLLFPQQRLAVHPLRVAGSQPGGNPIGGGSLLEIIVGMIGHGEFADGLGGSGVLAGISIGADQQAANRRAHRVGVGQLGKIGRQFHGKQSARQQPGAYRQNGGEPHQFPGSVRALRGIRVSREGSP